jgi:hypothetical protein
VKRTSTPLKAAAFFAAGAGEDAVFSLLPQPAKARLEAAARARRTF